MSCGGIDSAALAFVIAGHTRCFMTAALRPGHSATAQRDFRQTQTARTAGAMGAHLSGCFATEMSGAPHILPSLLGCV